MWEMNENLLLLSFTYSWKVHILTWLHCTIQYAHDMDNYNRNKVLMSQKWKTNQIFNNKVKDSVVVVNTPKL